MISIVCASPRLFPKVTFGPIIALVYLSCNIAVIVIIVINMFSIIIVINITLLEL